MLSNLTKLIYCFRSPFLDGGWFCTPRGHLATCGDNFDGHTQLGGGGRMLWYLVGEAQGYC